MRQPQPPVKSPVTNEPMSKRLFPAVQVRNTLKRLVESGAISGSKADAWKQAMAEEAEVVALRVKPEGGDAKAMRHLGFSYRTGKRGLKKDLAQAFTWLKRAADLKDVGALMPGARRTAARPFLGVPSRCRRGARTLCFQGCRDLTSDPRI